MSDTTLPPGGASEGERRKREALARLAQRRRALVRRAGRALLKYLLDFDTATADHLRALVTVPPGINPKVFGAVFAGLSTDHLIRQAGFEQSRRPESHRRPVGIWQLADRDKALAWLDFHPDLQDPPAEQSLFDS